MVITYNPDNNIITIEGGTSTTPLSFEDIYAADIANSWRVFQKYGDKNYKSNAKLLFTNCYFTDSYTTLLMENLGQWGWDYIFKMTTGAICEFDSVSFYNYEPTYECGYRADNTADVEFNNCAFYSHPASKRVLFNGSPNNCLFNKCYSELYYTGVKAIFKDSIIGGRYAHIASPNVECVFDNLQIDTENAYCFWFPTGSFAVNGGKYNATSKLCYIRNANEVNIKNTKLEKSNITVQNDTDVSLDFKIAYDVLFRIIDENGSPINKTMKITDKNDNVIFNEPITEQNIELPLYSLVVVGDGTAKDYTESDYTAYLPYKIEVYDDLKTYYSGFITSLTNQNRLIEITLTEETKDIFVEIENLKTELLRHSAKTESLLLK